VTKSELVDPTDKGRNSTVLPLTMVSYMLPLFRTEVREYIDPGGYSPFAAWSDGLNREAAAKGWRRPSRASNRATCPMPRALGPVFTGIGLILAPGIEFTSARMEIAW
jgi:hypothetical protein